MKRLLTLALVFAVMAVPIYAFTSVKSSKSNASARVTVTKVNPINHTFTGTVNGEELTFDAKTLPTPPAVGEVFDATYTPPAKPGLPIYGATLVKSSKSNASARAVTTSTNSPDETGSTSSYRTATPEQMVTGKVLSVNPKDKTFTVETSGKQVTFFANQLKLPDVGKMMDIHYIQPTPGGPMEATSIQPTNGGTFAVTNLNSSRSNISVAGDTSATSKAIEPPPQKPKQEASISESGTMSSFRTATCPNVMTGKVLRVKKEDNIFTVMSKGKEVTLFAGKLNLPKAGEIIDICYTPKTPGGPLTSISLNSSRSNIY